MHLSAHVLTIALPVFNLLSPYGGSYVHLGKINLAPKKFILVSKKFNLSSNKKGSVLNAFKKHLREKKVAYSLVRVFVIFMLSVLFMLFMLFVRVKSFRKKQNKTTLMTSLTLLLT